MQITLYKNCILNDKYDNVFSFGKFNGNKVLDTYLGSLSRYIINIDNTYQDRNGTIVFDSNQAGIGNIYQYNYMKVSSTYDDGTSIIRYCFIDSIRIRNELCYVSYSEDIWHSYGDSMYMNKGLLSSNRLADYSETYFSPKCDYRLLPTQYDGNNSLQIDDILSDTEYMILANVQIYNGTTSGDINERVFKTVRISYNGGDGGDYYYSFSLDEAMSIISKLSIYQSKNNYSFTPVAQTGSTRYYQISNFTIIPRNFGIYDYYESNELETYGAGIVLIQNSPTLSSDLCKLEYLSENAAKPQIVYSNSIYNNYKRLSIGTFSSQIDVINNGGSIDYEILYSCNDFSYNILLNINNTIIDITRDFEIDVPFEAMLGEKNSALKLNKVFSNFSNIWQIGKNISVGKYIKWGNWHNINVGDSNTTALTRYADYDADYPNGIEPRMKTRSGVYKYKASFKNDVSGNIMSLIKDNAPIYSSQKGNINFQSGMPNIYYGICSYVIDADNDSYVTSIKDNVGYDVFEIVSNLNKTGIMGNNSKTISNSMRTKGYNAIKFSYANIYGSFPNDIREILESILLKGTKVWFTENVI